MTLAFSHKVEGMSFACEVGKRPLFLSENKAAAGSSRVHAPWVGGCCLWSLGAGVLVSTCNTRVAFQGTCGGSWAFPALPRDGSFQLGGPETHLTPFCGTSAKRQQETERELAPHPPSKFSWGERRRPSLSRQSSQAEGSPAQPCGCLHLRGRCVPASCPPASCLTKAGSLSHTLPLPCWVQFLPLGLPRGLLVARILESTGGPSCLQSCAWLSKVQASWASGGVS